MKRLFSIILVSLILMLTLSSLMVSVSAEEEPWVMSSDAMYITHGDKTYEYLDYNSFGYYQIMYEKSYSYNLEEDEFYAEIDLEFADDETRRKFRGSYIYSESREYLDTIFNVELYYEGSFIEDSLYVEQSQLDRYKKIANGVSDTYYTNNEWNEGEGVTITASELDSIKNSGKTTMSGIELKRMNSDYPLYATDPEKVFCMSTGTIFWDEFKSNMMYIILFGDYNVSDFTFDGYFDVNIRKDYTVYAINDEELREELRVAFETTPSDELEWVAPDEEVNTAWATIFCTIIFGVFSVLVIAFAVVMLIVIKDKKYRRNFTIMLIGAAVVLISYVVILLILI